MLDVVVAQSNRPKARVNCEPKPLNSRPKGPKEKAEKERCAHHREQSGKSIDILIIQGDNISP